MPEIKYELVEALGVVSEAKDLGIETDTPDQIAKMKSLWGE
jgi:hypothetical protein